MPSIPIYADQNDFGAIHEFLNQNEQIAYIVPDGSRLFRARWRAIRPLPKLETDRLCLWHFPGGPLTLPGRSPTGTDRPIADPWKGWTGPSDNSHPNCPFFGAGHPAVILLNHHPQSRESSGGIGMSSFEWIGNRYAAIGSPASEATGRFWQTLRNWVKQHAIKIPRLGATDGPEPDIWAFESALAVIRQGRPRDSNP